MTGSQPQIEGERRTSLTSGADPARAFPCDHLLGGARTGWSSPRQTSPIEELRLAVLAENWGAAFAERRTIGEVQKGWGASAERCAALQCLMSVAGARRVLEIGTFCGIATLALAEAIPDDGEVVTIELDGALVEFGEKFWMRSESFKKITSMVGQAQQCIAELISKSSDPGFVPFDAVIIDADKATLPSYFETIWRSSGFLSEKAIVVCDVTPQKGVVPIRFKRFGREDEKSTSSGEEYIAALRRTVKGTPDAKSYEFSSMLVIKRKEA